jgi:protease-4
MQRRISAPVVWLAFSAWLLAGTACAPQVNLLGGYDRPLTEYTLQGSGADKVLLLNITGSISNQPRREGFSRKPGLVQEVVSRLRKAEDDDGVKAVLLMVNSPGGSTTASELLYHEIVSFRKETGKPVVALFLDVAASGAVYCTLGADWIMAHPTTITGSVGTIFISPKVGGLMDKVGVNVEIHKSGRNKDITSPFRPSTPEEKKILQAMIERVNDRFLALVRKHRQVSDRDMEVVATARVFNAAQAEDMGLVDAVGHLDDAAAKAGELAGIGSDPRLVVYRRSAFADDTAYNTLDSESGLPGISLLETGLGVTPPSPGFHHAWLPMYREY